MAVITYKISQAVGNSLFLHPKKWSDVCHKIIHNLITTIKGLLALDPLFPIREYLRNIKIDNPQFARQLCDLIPYQCPFERDFKLFGKVLFHIPPLCKLNPLYDDLVELRFRAQCYLADEWGESL